MGDRSLAVVAVVALAGAGIRFLERIHVGHLGVQLGHLLFGIRTNELHSLHLLHSDVL